MWFAAHEGTASPLQWAEDFDAVMVDVPRLGSVSQGFEVGLEEAWGEIASIIGNSPWVSCGHSRGAAQATLMTGHGVCAGHPPLYRVVFGEPPSCDQEAAKIIGSVPSYSFCNEWAGDMDPIVLVPAYIPPLFPYARVEKLTKLHAAPSPGNPWLDYPANGALHYMPDYQRNVELMRK